jgi:hypothetical protein
MNLRWSDAASIYTTALAAAEDLYASALSKTSQASELADTKDLYRRAAYAYAQTQKPEALGKAIATLEQGRARGLRETLERDRADLTDIATINPDLHDRYKAVAATLYALETTERAMGLESPTFSAGDYHGQAIQARADLKVALEEIRQIPGYENFLACLLSRMSLLLSNPINPWYM